MKWTKNIAAHISAFEQEKGEIIKPEVVELIKAMAAAGDQFGDLGEKDARSGRVQLTKEAFIEWGRQDMNKSESEDNSIVDLMYKCYLEGYNTGKASA